jgi:hypothetical protein
MDIFWVISIQKPAGKIPNLQSGAIVHIKLLMTMELEQ